MYIQGTDSHRRAWPPVRRHCKQLSCRHLHRHLKCIIRGGGRKIGEGGEGRVEVKYSVWQCNNTMCMDLHSKAVGLGEIPGIT